MIYFYAYLISCLPALGTTIYTIWYDIQCRRGKKKPDFKFGYNWQWPQWFGFTQLMIVFQLIPVANLYFGWVMMIWLIWDEVTDKYR